MFAQRKFIPILLSILSGVLLTASFESHYFFLSYVSLIPFLFALEKSSLWGKIKYGFAFGITHFITLCYWITWVISHYGGLNIFMSTLAFIGVVVYLSIYPLTFVLICHYTEKTKIGFLIPPFAWVTSEFLRATIFTGFPWCLLGYTQVAKPVLAQVADLGGVYLLSFLLFCINYGLYIALSPKFKLVFKVSSIAICGFLIGFQFAYGVHKLNEHLPYMKNLKVAIIQPNIPQALKWDKEYKLATTQKLIDMTESVTKFKPHIIIWPETALPFFFQEDSELKKMVVEGLNNTGSVFIFGSPAYEKTPQKTHYFNRLYVYNTVDSKLYYYDKLRLVPFGEYIPIGFLAPLVEKIVGELGEFSKGKMPNVVGINGINIGLLICYESIFPYLSDMAKAKQAEIIVNCTNDAWFGHSSAPYQHFNMAILRAIENRTSMIRAANTGISGVIDEKGIVRLKSDIFVEDVLITELNIKTSGPTIYNKWGKYFPFYVTLITLLFFAMCLCLSFFDSMIHKKEYRHHHTGK